MRCFFYWMCFVWRHTSLNFQWRHTLRRDGFWRFLWHQKIRSLNAKTFDCDTSMEDEVKNQIYVTSYIDDLFQWRHFQIDLLIEHLFLQFLNWPTTCWFRFVMFIQQILQIPETLERKTFLAWKIIKEEQAVVQKYH